ncbi:hypothetical protein NC01_10005 [Streptococcus uberis]|nr:hypothetical protein NC01_10005 [Streptococcus uberis]
MFLVDFSIFPHLGNPELPCNTLDTANEWVKQVTNKSYAIDDLTVIQAINQEITMLSNNDWHEWN